jgi:outer membrane protein
MADGRLRDQEPAAVKGLLCLLVVTASAGAAAADQARVAVVDFRRAVGETDEGRRATAQLKRLFESKQKEIDERQQQLRKAAEDLERKRTLIAADVVRKQEGELQQQAQALKQLLDRHQEELTRKQSELLESVLGRMNRIVATIATAENLSLVLDRGQPGGVVFARPHLDITNELIRRFNAGEATPPAGRSSGRPGSPAAPGSSKR